MPKTSDSKAKTRQELHFDGTVAAWKAVYAAINCGDSAERRKQLAMPAIEFLESEIRQLDYVPLSEHVVVVPKGSVFNADTGTIGSVQKGQRYWSEEFGWSVATEDIAR
jgi:hypothetical protein